MEARFDSVGSPGPPTDGLAGLEGGSGVDPGSAGWGSPVPVFSGNGGIEGLGEAISIWFCVSVFVGAGTKAAAGDRVRGGS